MKPRYSAIRIETAKQKALTGESFSGAKKSERTFMDWTDADEAALKDLVGRWESSTGHAGLNTLIDTYPFSGGAHSENTGIGRLITVDHGNGDLRYLDKNTPFETPAYKDEGIKFQGNVVPIR